MCHSLLVTVVISILQMGKLRLGVIPKARNLSYYLYDMKHFDSVI